MAAKSKKGSPGSPVRLSRRGFFGASAAAGGLAVSGGLFQGLVARQAGAAAGGGGRGAGYGPLTPAGADLALPPGFQYAVLSEEGQIMDDGFPVPYAMDGMCALPLPNGNVRLVRNHENRDEPRRFRPRTNPADTSTTNGFLNARLGTHYGPRAFAYDTYAVGGTTSLEVEAHGKRRLVGQHWSLVGTTVNCSGGPTPWGSWLSCEETTDGPSSTGFTQTHGWVFEVPIGTSAGKPVGHPDGIPAQPIKQLGRFRHEAVAIDPATGIVYETEDNEENCGFYRFVPTGAKPTKPGDLLTTPGQLQMLAVVGQPKYDTSPAVDPLPGSTTPPPASPEIGAPLAVEWVTIDDPLAASKSVFSQGQTKGGARFRKLEGCWFSGGKVYMHASSGGRAGFGQVWVYDVAASTLTLVFDSPGPSVLDRPDNMGMSPRGGIVVCEDGSSGNYVRGISPSGQVFDFARNLRNGYEFAGVCFSPDGDTLFLNLFGRDAARDIQVGNLSTLRKVVDPEPYERACTVAIWGPWKAGGGVLL